MSNTQRMQVNSKDIMFCRNCGNQLDDKAIACTRCGVSPQNGTAFCQNCGKTTGANAVVCVNCGVMLATVGNGAKLPGADKKLPAGICGILIGALGLHKFILGYTTSGVIMLLITLLTCGWGAIPMWIIGFVEGIIYLTKSDEDFVRTYIESKKEWF
jgi:TM2 domain-containing membrane protein YozV